MKIICPNCGNEVDDENKFCDICGYKLGKSAQKITIYDVVKALNESLIQPSNNNSVNQLIQNEIFTVYKKHTIDEIANMQMPEKEYDWTAACSIDEDERDLESALPDGGY